MKKDHVGIPKPSSRFQKVSCAECNEFQVVYSHASTTVTCNSCGNVLAERVARLARAGAPGAPSEATQAPQGSPGPYRTRRPRPRPRVHPISRTS